MLHSTINHRAISQSEILRFSNFTYRIHRKGDTRQNNLINNFDLFYRNLGIQVAFGDPHRRFNVTSMLSQHLDQTIAAASLEGRCQFEGDTILCGHIQRERFDIKRRRHDAGDTTEDLMKCQRCQHRGTIGDEKVCATELKYANEKHTLLSKVMITLPGTFTPNSKSSPSAHLTL
jgi:hypothetical protein